LRLSSSFATVLPADLIESGAQFRNFNITSPAKRLGSAYRCDATKATNALDDRLKMLDLHVLDLQRCQHTLELLRTPSS